jgi:ubiquinone biosynthesis protein
MKVFKQLHRLIFINYVLLKHGLDEIVLATRVFKPLRFLMYFSPSRWSHNRNRPQGVRIREACEELGPIFIKFGQLLSTRADLLPDEIASELAKLQDQVPPFCGQQAQLIIEHSLGKPISELFANFDTTPLASASISQVHAATMLDGQSVVVKVLRPNIKKHVARDIEILLIFAKLTNKYWPGARNFKPYEVVLEIQKSIYDELDLMREAANASQLRRNFTNSHLLYVPAIYWSHTKTDVLTLERIYGIPVSNIKELKAQKTDLKCLAERGVEIFFTQVFRDCFFHADMHPGNVWVSLETPSNPKYMALDFGIIGTLGPQDQHYLAENFLAFFKRDYRRVAELHVESGWVPKNTRVDEFESAIRCVCEPIFEKPLKDISFGKTLLRLFQTARRFDMQVQPQLILLQKTLISVEGLGRQLYPDLDLWHTAKPFLEDWMRNRVGSSSLMRKLRNYGPFWLDKLPDLPGLIYKALQSTQVESNQQIMRSTNNSATTAIRPSVWYYFVLGAVSAALVTILLTRFLYD